jgi:hypothetical protein
VTNKYVGDPQIRQWNPIALWIAIHGGCDPLGGTRAIDQVTTGLMINELAANVTDETARKAIKTAAATVIAKNAKSIAGESL